MSIASEITRLQNAKASLKASIEAKGVTVSSEATLDEYPELVDSIPTGSSDEVEKTVNFYDYDGTRVYSFTGEEVQALTELPSAPDHSADEVQLTFDEWNWTLTEIKSYNTKYPKAIINVGANYHTTDDKHHIYFNIVSDDDESGVAVGNVSGTVDWGDGTVEEVSGTAIHLYTSSGTYHCTITGSANIEMPRISTYYPDRGKVYKIFLSNYTQYLGRFCCENLVTLSVPSSIKRVYDLTYCRNLKSFTIPRNLTYNLSEYSFYDISSLRVMLYPGNLIVLGPQNARCYALNSVTIPDTITTFNAAFAYCHSLTSINIPDSVTSIPGSCFYECYSLQEVIIPENVTSIGSNAFKSCYSLSVITMLPTSPPAIQSSSFDSLYLKRIYVPYSSDHSILEAYQADTNWSTFSSIMRELPE